MIEIRKYEKKDKNEAMAIWNAVVREGIAFYTCMNDWALPNSVLSHRASA